VQCEQIRNMTGRLRVVHDRRNGWETIPMTLESRSSLRTRSCSRPDSKRTAPPFVIEYVVTGMWRLLAEDLGIRTGASVSTDGAPSRAQSQPASSTPWTRKYHVSRVPPSATDGELSIVIAEVIVVSSTLLLRSGGSRYAHRR
jgi:hypothetical protein